MGGVGGDGGEGVVGVDVAPVLEGGAVVQERGGGAGGRVEPGAVAAVEVLGLFSAWVCRKGGDDLEKGKRGAGGGGIRAYPILVIPAEDFVAFRYCLRDGLVTQPRLHHHVLAQCEVPLQEHLLPHHRRHPRRSYVIVVEIHKFLE